jgi:guanylate kinase
MNNPLFLFVGRSASGKTTIADILEEKYGYTQVRSYTTRPPRYDDEIGHIFITKEEFKELEDIVSYTLYHENEYGTTAKLLDENSIFVVDVPGVESLLEKYKSDRPICIIYFDASVYNRINRMLDRGNCDTFIISRLLQDEKDDWYKQLDSLVWKYANIIGKDVQLYSVNANNNLKQVLELVLYYMKRYTED